jgi:hypothetical protein
MLRAPFMKIEDCTGRCRAISKEFAFDRELNMYPIPAISLEIGISLLLKSFGADTNSHGVLYTTGDYLSPYSNPATAPLRKITQSTVRRIVFH